MRLKGGPRPARSSADAMVGRGSTARVRQRASAGLRARGGDEVAVRRRADTQAPPERRHLALELTRVPETLDDVELAAVREATPGDLAGRAPEVPGVAEPRVVAEDHPALRLQRPPA